MNARMLNIILGVWLFVSAFIWRHAPAAMANTWICGMLAVVFAAFAMAWPAARFLNSALAIWLFFSTFGYSDRAATLWNNLLVAIAMFIVSMIPSVSAGRPVFRTPRQPRTV